MTKTVTPTLHLMEPYRSALVSMGYDEGLVFIDGEGASHSDSLRIGRAPELRQDLLQLLLLFKQASIAWTESSTDEKLSPFRKQLLHTHGKGLQTAGVVQLLRDSEIEGAANEELRGVRSIGDLWRPFVDDISAFAPLISRQLTARGKPISEPLIQFALSVRRGDDETAWRLARVLTPDDREAGREIERETHSAILRYDVPVLSEVHQCIFAEKRANQHNSSIVGPAIGSSTPQIQANHETAEAARRLVAVIAEELLKQELVLPTSLAFKSYRLDNRTKIPSNFFSCSIFF